MADVLTKIVDERLYLPNKRGNGLVRREIWTDRVGRVVRYNLAYINPLMYAGDNGRVIGYDSAHGVHHRHCRGKVSLVDFASFEQIEGLFQKDLSQLLKERRYAKS